VTAEEGVMGCRVLLGNALRVNAPCSEAGSYLRLIDFVYLSTLGLIVIKKKNALRVHAPCRKKSWGLQGYLAHKKTPTP